MKFSELQNLQRREGITVISSDERIATLESRLSTIAKERDALRARIDEMEKQEQVAIQHRVPSVDFRGECVGYSEWRDGKGLEHWLRRTLYAIPGAQPAQSVPTPVLVAIADLVTQMEIVDRVGFIDTPDDKDSCAAFCVAEGTWLELMKCVESLAVSLAAAPEANP